MRALAAALLAVLAAAPERPRAASPAAPPQVSPTAPGPVEAKRRAIAERMIALGSELRLEIERGDAAALAARVPPDGLRCAGRVIPRAHVARDLRAEGTWLHGMLFGGPGAPAPQGGGAASLRELFRRAGAVEIAVGFVADGRAGPAGRPCLRYRARTLGAPPFPLCFEERGGAWLFTESLYPCG